MIPQHFLLYAVDPRDSSAYVVVGWKQATNYVQLIPFLAPVDGPGHVWIRPETLLVYSTERPAPLPPALPDDTVVMQVPTDRARTPR